MSGRDGELGGEWGCERGCGGAVEYVVRRWCRGRRRWDRRCRCRRVRGRGRSRSRMRISGGVAILAGRLCDVVWGDRYELSRSTSVDVGSTVQVVVTASNSVGSGSASSAASGVVALPGGAVGIVVRRWFRGRRRRGRRCRRVDGSWAGTQPILCVSFGGVVIRRVGRSGCV